MIPKILTSTTLGAVTSWAWKNFSDDFAKIPTCKDYTLQRFHLPGFGNNGQFKGIVIGTASEEIREDQRATVDVLAWLEGHQIAVGYISQLGWKIHAVNYDDILDASIHFNAPFSWVLAAADETAVLRFESLIRHSFLARGFKNAIKGKGNLSKFRDHFPGACRDVAQKATAISAEWEKITAPLEPGSIAHIEQIPESGDMILSVDLSSDDLIIVDSVTTESIVQEVASEVLPVEAQVVNLNDVRTQVGAETRSQRMRLSTTLNTKDVERKAEKPRTPIITPHTTDPTTKPVATIATTASQTLHGLEMAAFSLAGQRHTSSDSFQDQLQRIPEDYTQSNTSLAVQADTHITNTNSDNENGNLRSRIHNLENDLVSVEAEKINAMKELAVWKDRYALLNAEVEYERNEAVCWKDRHSGAVDDVRRAREAEKAWELKHVALKTTLGNVLGAQS
ncbi:hypothetical protein EKO04_007479 [Ascochyta lentis]|uniref:Uncharacterized protein n=1 Tax=Ascochyta lentis TaxID=205686 RepID=A0A8H7J357_9PLEO|nr:hypothetical protein EKO04_007479 [Ascochyta lentis]